MVENSRGRHVAFWLAFSAAFAADIAAKTAVFSAQRDTIFSAFGGFFQITRTTNTGAVFGMGEGMNALFSVLSAAFLVLAVPWFVHEFLPRFRSPLAWALAGVGCGGVLGNYLDRIAVGHVRDFISVWAWPVFNLADAFIVSSVAVFAFLLLFGGSSRKAGVL